MRLRHLLRERDVRGRTDEQVLSVYRDHGVVPKVGRTDNFNKTPDDLSNYKLVLPGDVVVNKMKAWQGSIAVSPHRGIVSGDYLVCAVVTEVEQRFLHHALRSRPMIAEYMVRSKGIRPSQWRLYWDDLAEIEIRIPSAQDQRAIAFHLDAETARLDALIARKAQLGELLRQRQRRSLSERLGLALAAGADPKPSGPWQIQKLGRVASVQGGLTLGKRYEGPTVTLPYLRVANVQDGYFLLDEVTTIEVPLTDADRYRVRYGDVLVLEGNGNPENLGRGAVWRGEVPGCLHQNHVHAVRPNPGVLLPDYLALVLQTEWARFFFTAGSNQVSIATLSQSRLAELPIPLPPLGTQGELVKEVGRERARVDAVSSALAEQADLVTEHRQALITAAVTGELAVPGMAA